MNLLPWIRSFSFTKNVSEGKTSLWKTGNSSCAVWLGYLIPLLAPDGIKQFYFHQALYAISCLLIFFSKAQLGGSSFKLATQPRLPFMANGTEHWVALLLSLGWKSTTPSNKLLPGSKVWFMEWVCCPEPKCSNLIRHLGPASHSKFRLSNWISLLIQTC